MVLIIKGITATSGFLFLIMMLGMNTAVAKEDPGFDALSDPLEKLKKQELADFNAGLEVFERRFGPTQGGGGRPAIGGGPLRNTFGPNSCVQCHRDAINPTTGERDGTKDGAGHAAFRASQVTAYDEDTGECDHLEDRGGPGFQINTGALRALGFPSRLAQENPGPFEDVGGEYIPVVSQHGVPTGPRDDRTTNDLFGLGLLDAMSDASLSALADPDDANGDGISGRVHWVTDHHGEIHAGKFGRKAEVAHLDEFNAEAFQNEQGVTNPEFPDDGVLVVGYADEVNPDPQDLVTVSLADGFADPEVSQEDLDLVNAYVRFLAPPRQNPRAMSVKGRGKAKQIFLNTGCAACHTPELVTGESASKALRNQVIQPYSDMLLHDMGPDLAEGCKVDATPSEWRTEPLWGLRFVPTGYMHDGRADTLEEAIGFHGGEGAGARDAYSALSPGDQALLLDFLKTL